MKRITTLILGVLLCIACALSIGCVSSSLDGTYKFKTMTGEKNGETITVNVGEQFPADSAKFTVTEDFIVIELKKDFTFMLSSTSNQETANIFGGKWEKDENVLVLTPDGNVLNPIECEIKNKTITFELEGVNYVLQKV